MSMASLSGAVRSSSFTWLSSTSSTSPIRPSCRPLASNLVENALLDVRAWCLPKVDVENPKLHPLLIELPGEDVLPEVLWGQGSLDCKRNSLRHGRSLEKAAAPFGGMLAEHRHIPRLNGVQASAGVQLRGIEDTKRKAQHTAILQFKQWLKRARLMEAPSRAKKQLTQPFYLNSKSEAAKRLRKVSKGEAYYRSSA
jgi:hypothetical protein